MSNINSKQAIRLPLFIGAAIALGIFIGAEMAGDSGKKPNVDKSLYKLRQILTYIDNDYVDEVNTEDLVEGVIEDMLTKLDPHTVYIPERELKITQSQLQGNFEGIGVEFNIFKDTIYVVAPLSGGPSEKLGIISGDRIVQVDDENVAGIGITTFDVMNKLRGPKGSEVKVGILRKGVDDMIDFTIKRDVIPEYSVNVSYMVDDEIGYIKVGRFSLTTYMEFKEAMGELQEKGMTKLILDLTGNPGGYLDQAVKMIDEFLDADKMIVYTYGKETRYNDQYFSRKKGDFINRPVIVLIDEGSASASEIVSGAMQDHDRGLIVGRRSFGKGLVQLPISLNDGSELRLTISRYYTPSGRSIQKPYTEDRQAYAHEYISRFERGEVFNKDSISVVDSLAFTTEAGRTVYGGGGIIPDYFVAYDTSENSAYLNKLFTTNTIQQYTLLYSEENRKELEEMGLDEFVKNFTVSEDIIKEIISNGQNNGATFQENGFKKSKSQLARLIKAYIARGVWDNEGFYPVINQQNEIFLRALDLFDEAERLVKEQ